MRAPLVTGHSSPWSPGILRKVHKYGEDKIWKRMFKKNRDYSFQAFDHFSLVLIISNEDSFSSYLIQEPSNQTSTCSELYLNLSYAKGYTF